MDRFDHIHSEPNSTPLRRDAHFRVRQGAGGQREEELLEGKAISMSADGSIDCAVTTVVHFYHCGHPATDAIGCACAEAGRANLTCRECSKEARCARCLKPVCLEHLQRLQTAGGSINLCGRCKVAMVRQQRWQALGRALLKPFVDFESRKER
jgi:hypothetical protein